MGYVFPLPSIYAWFALLRPDQDGIRPVIELLGRVLATYSLESLTSTVTVATPRGIRIRRART
ncbi:MAG: hypothetical protein Kow0063_34660 [Anaerolineae bacterium]